MRMNVWWAAGLLAAATLLPVSTVRAGDISCKMTFQLSGWSVFYKTAKGTGTVRCSNGQSLQMKLRAKGGGLTFGKTKISDGVGKFTGVSNVRDVLGHYAEAVAHAGAEKSAAAQVLTKGSVSLALSGTGEGWNLGVAFGAFIIE
ncbi:Secreted protein OS=Rhodanobacter lindaniclasticus OX=75310 GN=B1991_03295 PE=4 SV=1 [Rhodanobacter lindaniclasticus]